MMGIRASHGLVVLALASLSCSNSTLGLGGAQDGAAGGAGGLPFLGGPNRGAPGTGGGGTAGGDPAGVGGAPGGGAGPGAPAGGTGAPGPGAPGPGAGGAPAAGGGKGVSCTIGSTQCTDGKDNDGDGLIDAMDPECSGPCDDDEGSFATGIPGDNRDDERSCHQDCFFDGNSGQGDDGCDWDIRCDPLNKTQGKCAYKANGPAATCAAAQPQRCIDFCRSRAPNGCDCFGCCALPGQPYGVKLSATCNSASLADPDKCPRCTPNPTCMNTCEKCEVCMGKPSPDPSCPSIPGGQPPVTTPTADAGAGPDAPGAVTPPPAPSCDAGKVSCGPGGQVAAGACPNGDYCVTGCCIRIVEELARALTSGRARPPPAARGGAP
jgi:hypothetical protein